MRHYVPMLIPLVLCHAVGRADDQSIISDVRFGFQQTVRVATWAPVSVTLFPQQEDFQGRVEVVTPDPSGSQCVVTSDELSIAKGQSRRVNLLTMAGRLETFLTVRIVTDDVIVEARRLSTTGVDETPPDFTVLPHSRRIWLAAGSLQLREPDESESDSTKLSGVVHVAPLNSPGELPDDWRVLSACSTIVLPSGFDVNADQFAALTTWLKRGGHLIVAVGNRTESIDRRQDFLDSGFANLLPAGAELEAAEITDFSGFETYVARKGGEQQFRVPLLNSSEPGTRFRIPGAKTVVSSLNGDLVVRIPVGFGRMTLIGTSLESGPISRWRQGQLFLIKLADSESRTGTKAESTQRISRSGITELSTQLRRSLEGREQEGGRSALVVLGLILLYLLLIGPVDYFLVHRVLKRPRLTWVTFPIIVVLGAILAHSSARATNGTRNEIAQLDCIDVDAESGFVHQTSWGKLYSTENRRFRAALHSKAPAFLSTSSEQDCAIQTAGIVWFGASEQNYGGMYRGGGLELGRTEYRLSKDLQTIEDLPVPVWSSRMLTAESVGETKADLFELALYQGGSGGQLARNSTLTHHLPLPVSDWVLVYGTRAYFFDPEKAGADSESRLMPGRVWSPTDKAVGSQELKSFLTGIYYELTRRDKPGDRQYVSAQREYDPRSTNLDQIVHMLTLHSVAGGRKYTGLTNDALAHLELSSLAPLNRAILIGRLSSPGSILEMNGEAITATQHDTFIRIVLPVQARTGDFELIKLAE